MTRGDGGRTGLAERAIVSEELGDDRVEERPLAPEDVPAREQESLRHFLANRTKGAFEDICRIQIPRLLRYFEGHGCDPPSAEDLTQEVLLAVFRGAGGLREAGAFRGWVFAIARNILLQYWRKGAGGVREVGLEILDLKPPVTEPEEPHEISERFQRWMDPLGPEERKVMRLRFVDDLEYHEIASALRIPIGTVKWRIFNSRMKLLKHFGPKGDGTC